MKNKKIIIIFLILLIILAILFAIVKPFYDSYIFENTYKKELVEYLTNIEDDEKKQNEINSAIEKGWITSEDLVKYIDK